MRRVTVTNGDVVCPRCGARNQFTAKRTGKAKWAAVPTLGIGVLAMPKRLHCNGCGKNLKRSSPGFDDASLEAWEGKLDAWGAKFEAWIARSNAKNAPKLEARKAKLEALKLANAERGEPGERPWVVVAAIFLIGVFAVLLVTGVL